MAKQKISGDQLDTRGGVWNSDDGIRTVAYQYEEEEPVAIIDFGI